MISNQHTYSLEHRLIPSLLYQRPEAFCRLVGEKKESLFCDLFNALKGASKTYTTNDFAVKLVSTNEKFIAIVKLPLSDPPASMECPRVAFSAKLPGFTDPMYHTLEYSPFAAEMGSEGKYMACGWTPSGHRNYGTAVSDDEGMQEAILISLINDEPTPSVQLSLPRK